MDGRYMCHTRHYGTYGVPGGTRLAHPRDFQAACKLLHFGTLEAFHGRLKGLQHLQHLQAGLVGRRVFLVIHVPLHLFEQSRSAFLNAGDLLLPGELSPRAIQEHRKILDVLARIPLTLVFCVYPRKLTVNGRNSFFTALNVRDQSFQFEDHLPLLGG